MKMKKGAFTGAEKENTRKYREFRRAGLRLASSPSPLNSDVRQRQRIPDQSSSNFKQLSSKELRNHQYNRYRFSYHSQVADIYFEDLFGYFGDLARIWP